MRSKIIVNLYYEPPKILVDYIKKSKGLYVPINCGNLAVPQKSEFAEKYINFEDEMPENIAHLNSKLNELTAIYAFWKNFNWQKLDYVGFNHYRRIFKLDLLMDSAQYDAIVMKPIRMRFVTPKPGIVTPKTRDDLEVVNGTVEDGYRICHVIEDFKKMEELVKKTPYGKLFDEWKSQSELNAPCNMFFMKAKMFDEYCNFIYPLVFLLEKQIDLTGRDGYQRRGCAFLAERLTSLFFFNAKKNGARLKEVDTLFFEDFRPSTATDNRGQY